MSAKISTEDLMKGNKLIAEFMGWKFNAYPELRHDNITKPNQDSWYYASYDKHEFNEHITNSIKYHSSWDWLMPVVEKIEALDKVFVSCRSEGDGGQILISYDGAVQSGCLYSSQQKLEGYFRAVVKFIQFYTPYTETEYLNQQT